jgi:hypothetical protein
MGDATMIASQNVKLYQMNIKPGLGCGVCDQTLDWWPSDSKENFHRMMQDPAHREYFHKYGWDQPGGITYEFNSLGFRGQEPDWSKPSLFTFGCSFTMGIGLKQEQTWPWLVGKALGLQVVNFAMGGKSSDWCFRMAQYWVRKNKPTLALMLAPPHERLELVTDDQGNGCEYTSHVPVTDQFLKTWFAHSDNQTLNNVKNRLAFVALGRQLQVPMLAYDAFEWFGKSREEVGYARDYMHAGPIGHEVLAARIINDWNEIKHT